MIRASLDQSWLSFYRFVLCCNIRRFTDACVVVLGLVFSERGRAFPKCYRPSVCCLCVVCLSLVTLVPPTQAVEIFGNISMAFGTVAIR